MDPIEYRLVEKLNQLGSKKPLKRRRLYSRAMLRLARSLPFLPEHVRVRLNRLLIDAQIASMRVSLQKLHHEEGLLVAHTSIPGPDLQSWELLRLIQEAVPDSRRREKSAFAVQLLNLLSQLPFVPVKLRVRASRLIVESQIGSFATAMSALGGPPVNVRYSKGEIARQPNSSGPYDTNLVASGSVDSFRSVSNTSASVRFHDIGAVSGYRVAPLKESCLSLPPNVVSTPSRERWLTENQTHLVEELWSLLGKYDVVSLDVFDTFLLRGSDSEAARFLEFSAFIRDELSGTEFQPLIEGISAESLAIVRARAMQHTYRFRSQIEGCSEGSIIEVAHYVARSLGGDTRMAERLLELEIIFEANVLHRNPVLSALVQRFKSAGKRAILISDMYLHADQIGSICARVDPIGAKAIDKIYSSADTILNKRSSKIFELVEKDFGLEPAFTVHVGDSSRSDVEHARMAGWNAMHFPVSRSEMRARQESLSKTIRHFDDKGINVREWAKL